MFMVWKTESDLKQILQKEHKHTKERRDALNDSSIGPEDIIPIKTTRTLNLNSRKEFLARLKKYEVDPVWL